VVGQSINKWITTLQNTGLSTYVAYICDSSASTWRTIYSVFWCWKPKQQASYSESIFLFNSQYSSLKLHLFFGTHIMWWTAECDSLLKNALACSPKKHCFFNLCQTKLENSSSCSCVFVFCDHNYHNYHNCTANKFQMQSLWYASTKLCHPLSRCAGMNFWCC
jgi:hypothetical protein